MIIVDLNQVMISNMMAQVGAHANQVDEGLLRHMVLNSIRSFRSKFAEDFGELVIACDGKRSWRKDIFPYYKAHRKKAREESDIDWNTIFTYLNGIREELKEYFPYKYIHVDGAEADDIIGTICKEHGRQLNNGEPILIMSGDKDFIQLQKYANVSQYDPVRKRWIKHSQPHRYLVEHIMKGDRGDGVPNIMSKDDCLINGRQKPIRSKFIETAISANGNNSVGEFEFDNQEVTRNFFRNRSLVDLDCTPDELRLNILEQFNEPCNDRSKLFGYFIEKKLKNLMDSIGDF